MDKKRKRYPTISVSSGVLVAMVVLMVTIGFIGNQKKNSQNDKRITVSKKTLLNMCHGLDYKDACMRNLPFKFFNNQHEPKDFLRMGFEAAMTNLRGAAQKAISLRTMQDDGPHLQSALTGCSQLAERAIIDLRRSLNHFLDHDIGNMSTIHDDLVTWVSAALTYQQTCLNGFLNTPALQNTNGVQVGENMRLALKGGMELTTNALGMTTRFATKFDASIEKTTTGQFRRLKSLETFPEVLDSKNRALLQANPNPAPAPAPANNNQNPNPPPADVKADLVVAQDGSGKYKTINEALKDIPQNGNSLFVLYIKEGVYNEQVTFTITMQHLMVVGDGPTKTKITGNKNVVDGTTTYLSATVAVEGDYFIGKDIGFENSAGVAKGQAVALRVGSDKSMFYNCHIDGDQDTLYSHTYRQFYRDCVITGTIDFIFGDSATVFQNCTFLIREPTAGQASVIMAQSRINVRQPTGFVLQNCTIIGDDSLTTDKASVEVYLGRPWTEFSRTIIMESFIGDIIRPEGYTIWNGTFGLDTSFYSEFNNRGPGSAKDKRVKWQAIKELTSDEIQRFTAKEFLQGDTWVPPSQVPYSPGFIFPPGPQTIAASPAQGNEDIPFENDRKCYGSKAKFDPSGEGPCT